MYSYADRLRAVELYIRLGKRLNATIRQLGNPTKNALRGWYREYEQQLDLRIAGKPGSVGRSKNANPNSARNRWPPPHLRQHRAACNPTLSPHALEELGYRSYGELRYRLRANMPPAFKPKPLLLRHDARTVRSMDAAFGVCRQEALVRGSSLDFGR
jgi:transposase-like protein